VIQTRSEPCYRLVPDPLPDIEMHYVEQVLAKEALKAFPGAALVQGPWLCGHLACDGCGTRYEDDEEGITHILTAQDEALVREAAIDGAGWTAGTHGRIHCPSCPPLPPVPGPGPLDQPLPFSEPS
jgi:hypothetical protein